MMMKLMKITYPGMIVYSKQLAKFFLLQNIKFKQEIESESEEDSEYSDEEAAGDDDEDADDDDEEASLDEG